MPTKIEWTEETWNAIRARANGRVGWWCSKVSAGCKNCYAERLNLRLGNGMEYALDKKDQIELFLDEKVLEKPLRWQRPRTIFPCSMTDLFADFVPDEWIREIFGVMAMTPRHTYQVLTKRPLRMLEFMKGHMPPVTLGNPLFAIRLPLPNVWGGISAETQQEYDDREGFLRHAPFAVRWLSLEPLLGPIDLRLPHRDEDGHCSRCGLEWEDERETREGHRCPPGFGPTFDWTVVGGESGKNARPMQAEWAFSIARQCAAAGVAFFMKQGSEANWPRFKDLASFPKSLRVRQFPKVRA